ncbi:MAG: hypothetical protein AAF485_19145 [Chloroflexota bacterium]
MSLESSLQDILIGNRLQQQIDQIIKQYLEDYLSGKKQIIDGLEEKAKSLNAAPILFDGIGPGTFLIRPDGQLMCWDESESQSSLWDIEKGSPFYAQILRAASRDFPELVHLIPLAPSGAEECSACQGQGSREPGWACSRCSGYGWILLDEK